MPNWVKNVAGVADLEIRDELIAVDYVSDRRMIASGKLKDQKTQRNLEREAKLKKAQAISQAETQRARGFGSLLT